jgi:hypothetical protein
LFAVVGIVERDGIETKRGDDSRGMVARFYFYVNLYLVVLIRMVGRWIRMTFSWECGGAAAFGAGILVFSKFKNAGRMPALPMRVDGRGYAREFETCGEPKIGAGGM